MNLFGAMREHTHPVELACTHPHLLGLVGCNHGLNSAPEMFMGACASFWGNCKINNLSLFTWKSPSHYRVHLIELLLDPKVRFPANELEDSYLDAPNTKLTLHLLHV